MGQKETFIQEELIELVPTENPKINRVNEICIELIDILHNECKEKVPTSLSPKIKTYTFLYGHILGEIINTHTNMLKLLNLKTN